MKNDDSRLSSRSASAVAVEQRTVIDEKPPALGPAAGKPIQFSVAGSICAQNVALFSGLTVKAFDRNIGADDTLLGKATTDANGHYSISYTLQDLGGKAAADLIMRVYRNDELIQESATICDASPAQTFDFSIAINLPESERFLSDLRPLLRNNIKLAELRKDDLEFLSSKTEATTRQLELLVESQQAANGDDNLANMYYGLLSQGLPAHPGELLARGEAELRGALDAATAAGLISEPSSEDIDRLVSQVLPRRRSEQMLRPSAKGERASLGDLLRAVHPVFSDQDQFTIADVVAKANGDYRGLTSKLQSAGLKAEQAAAVEHVLELGELTQHHLPLVQQLMKSDQPSTLRELVKMDRADWLGLLKQQGDGAPVGTPRGVPGVSDDERAELYVNSIVCKLQSRFPTATAAKVAVAAPDFPAQKGVAQFFSNLPDLDLCAMNVDGYVSSQGSVSFKGIAEEDRESVLKQVKRLQRIVQLSMRPGAVEATPLADTMSALLERGLDSGHKIASTPRSVFLALHSVALGGKDKAALIYDRAQFQHARSLLVYAQVKDAVEGITPGAIGMGRAQVQQDLITRFPGYAELFGSLDWCACAECRSVLSPAAYLVDLFEFLRNSKPNDAGQTPLDLLIGNPEKNLTGRRPDLAFLPLTCENTNTALPYLDLVNEVLESYVALGMKLDQSAAHDTGDAKQNELDANPQYINDKAYEVLNGEIYPFNLPFNLPVAEARAYLKNVGSSRHEVMRAWQKDQTAPVAVRGCAAERLGLTTEEYRVLTGEDIDPAGPFTPTAVAACYGYDPANSTGWEEQVTHVPEFLRRTGIAYTDLIELVKTRFVNPNCPQGSSLELLERVPLSFSTLTQLVNSNFANPSQQVLDALADAGITLSELAAWARTHYQKLATLIVLDTPDGTADLASTRLLHLDGTLLSAEELRRIQAFIRLWHKVEWSIAQLDLALGTFAATNITGDMLTRLAQIRQVQEDWHISNLQVLLALWSPINYRGKASLYESLFLNRSAQSDAVFTPDSEGDVLASATPKISDHVPALLAGLRISAADLAAIREDANLNDGWVLEPVLDPVGPGIDPVHVPDIPGLSPEHTLGTSLPVPPPGPPHGHPVFVQPRLTLANVSGLYRYAALAKMLSLRVPDLLALKTLSGIDPFAGPDRTLQFTQVFATVQNSPFNIQQLNYVYRHITAPTNLAPQAKTLLSLGKTLRTELTRIARDNQPVSDPGDEVARTKLSLLFDRQTVDQTLSMINGTAVYAAPLAAWPNDIAVDPPWFATTDFLDTAGLVASLSKYADPVSAFLWKGFSDDTQRKLADPQTPLEAQQSALVQELNAVVGGPSIYTDERFNATNLSPETKRLLALGTWQGAELARLNRSLLEDAYPVKLARQMPELVGAKIGFDAIAQVLRYQGGMTSAEHTALLQSSHNLPFTEAVKSLYQQPLVFIQDALTAFLDPPEAVNKLVRDIPALNEALQAVQLDRDLNPVPLGPDGAPIDPAKVVISAVGHKLDYLLSKLLPCIVSQLSHAYIKQTVAEAFTLDGAMAQLLLETILKSQADPTLPLIEDLLALTTAGLTGTYFPAADFTGDSTVHTDAAIAFDGNTVKLPNGIQSVRWEGQLIAPTSTALSFRVHTTGTARLWIGDENTPLELTPDGSELVSAPLALSAGQVFPLRLEVGQLGANGVVELCWKGNTLPKGLIPTENLCPRAEIDNFVAAATLLHKSAMLITTFPLDTEQVSYLSAHKSSFAGFDLNLLPTGRDTHTDGSATPLFLAWQRVNDVVTLQQALPKSEVTLVDVFRAASCGSAMAALATATGWDAQTLTAIADAAVFGLTSQDLGNEIWILRLKECVRQVKRFGVSPHQLRAWAKVGADFASVQSAAREIKKMVQAQYDLNAWLAVAKDINDPLREGRRDALVAYLLSRMPLEDANQLFEYFLIDTEMNACMETSRVKQAVSSVQLFVQRCLMGLESRLDRYTTREIGVAAHGIDAECWEWMKHYRVWEANRKIFLYPENWIEPELRDGKSPFFQELEGDILQNDVTPDNVESAFRSYLEKLDEVARLEIRGMYRQDVDADTNELVDIVHAFGRTPRQPHIYYYRRLQDGFWGPWEKVNTNIEGDHLIPVVWNRRLLLFWPIFTSKADLQRGAVSTVTATAPSPHWEIQLAWSEYKNGKWSPKQVTKEVLALSPENSCATDSQRLGEYYFKHDIVEGQLRIGCGHGGDDQGHTTFLGHFSLGYGVGDTIEVYGIPGPGMLIPGKPVGADVDGMLFTEKAANNKLIFPADPYSTYSSGGSYRALDNAPKYRLLYRDNTYQFVQHAPFFYQDAKRTFFVACSQGQPVAGNIPFYLTFKLHYHPFAGEFMKSLIRDGVPGVLTERNQTLGLPYLHAAWELGETISSAATGSASLIQSDYKDSKQNDRLELALCEYPAGLVHYSFDGTSWKKQNVVGGPTISSACLIQSNFTTVGNSHGFFEVAAREYARDLVHYRFDGTSWNSAGTISSAATSPACIIQPFDNDQLVAIVCEGNNLVLYHWPFGSWQRGTVITDKATSAGCIIQSTLQDAWGGRRYEVVVCEGNDLVHYTTIYAARAWIDHSVWQAREVITHNATGAAWLIQSDIRDGLHGNFEVVVPEGNNLVHYWLDNSRPGASWQQGQIITARATGSAGFIQSSLEKVNAPGHVADYYYGTFEVAALQGNNIVRYRHRDNQRFQFGFEYVPSTFIKDPYPAEEVDFAYDGAYSLYNWELFFHTPLLIATRLTRDQRFEDARKWLHYIFNPVNDSPNNLSPGGYWKVQPFKNTIRQSIQDMMMALANGDQTMKQQIEDWRHNPFLPHRIARMRPSAYQKYVFMKYLDNLLSWGDQLFGQNTIESINEAEQLYIMAANLLGPRPEKQPARGKAAPENYTQLKGKLDAFSNALVQLENEFPFSNGAANSGGPGQSSGLLGLGRTLYFGIPANDTLLKYWDTVADRLFKIRHCMNLQGMVQHLPLFEPPIDPALLVQAAAQGVDLSSVLSDIDSPPSPYRFTYVLRKALEMCSDVRAFGASLLSALEKNDAEQIALQRATQETAILKLMEDVKQQQVDEAEAQVATLETAWHTALARYMHYQMLLGNNSPSISPIDSGTELALPAAPNQPPVASGGNIQLLPQEASELDSSNLAKEQQSNAAAYEIAASILNLLPTLGMHFQPFGSGGSISFGGGNLAPALSAHARNLNNIAAKHTYDAAHASKMAGYFRRLQEWTLQSNLAAGEINQIARQHAAAKLRAAIARKELTVHQQQVLNAQAVEDTLTSKYTNRELYAWMISDVSATYFQAYQIAYDLAKKAERAYRFERGLTNSNFIQFGYWDNLRKGLQSGERLYLALKQLERAYQDQNKREYEITKHYSLLLNDPLALIALKETGHCEIDLPEAVFDADYPGHYMRRFKSVSLTVPCIVGPYTGINCTLTLLSNKTRTSSLIGSQYEEDVENGDDRFLVNFAPMQSIATSHAQNDSGTFELNFNDERYLPFEGAGAISRWRIDLPLETNAFDFSALSDVVLHLKYTAREGGDILRNAAKASLSAALANEEETAFARLFSLRHEFPTAWAGFRRPPDPAATCQSLAMELNPERFRLCSLGKTLAISKVDVFLAFKDPASDTTAYQKNGLPLSVSVTDGQSPVSGTLNAQPVLKGMPCVSLQVIAQPPVTLALVVAEADVVKIAPTLQETLGTGSSAHHRLNCDRIDDIFVVCHYAMQP